MFNHSEKGMSAADGGMYFNKWNFIEVRSFSFYLKHFSFIKYTNWRAQLCRGIFKKSNFVKKIDFWSKQLNFWWKTILFLKKKIFFSLCYNKVTHGFLKIFQPIRTSSLYMNVLFYHIDLNLLIILTTFNKFIISLMYKKNAV